MKHIMKFDNTITTWDEAIPLGNGAIGALIYGPSDALRLSLDRNGLWDCSDPPKAGGEYTYKRLIQCAEESRLDEMARIFHKPYSAKPAPTKLPAGKLIIDLGISENVESTINLYEAEAIFKAGNITMRAFIDAGKEIGLCDINSENISFKWEAPAYGKKTADTTGIDQSLAKLDYEPSISINETTRNIVYGGFTQKVNDSLTYGLIAAMKKSNGTTLIAYTVIMDQNRESVLRNGLSLVNNAIDNGYDASVSDHKTWWKEYWSQGYINVPDEFFSLNYMLGNYLLASCSRKGYPPMPLQGVWTADNGNLPPWKGDYHHDLNTQLSYLSYLKGNHLPEGEAFVDFLFSLEKAAENFSEKFYGVEGGLCLPSVMDIEGNPLGGWAMYSMSPTNMSWVCKTLIDHYYYTDDIDYLKNKAYPYIKKYGLLLKGILKEDSNGKLVLPISSSPEIHDANIEAFLTPNSNYDLSLITYIFAELSSLAKILGLYDDVSLWDTLCGKMDGLYVDFDSVLMLSRDERLAESHRHHAHMMAIHPLRQLRYENDRDRKIIDATVADLERLGPNAYVGYSYAWCAEFYAIQGNADKAYKALNTFWKYYCLPNGFHCNGDYQNKLGLIFTYRPFTLEGNICAIDALQEMMLYDGDGKTIIAPAIPDTWSDYSFKLRSKNGFVIEAKVENGRLINAVLEAYKDVDTELCLGNLSVRHVKLSSGDSLNIN